MFTATKHRAEQSRARILAGLGLLFLSLTVLVMLGTLDELEHKLFLRIYELSDAWKTPALILTQLGGPVALLLTAVLGLKRAWRLLLLTATKNGLLAAVLAQLIKFMVNRPRPSALFEEIVQRETSWLELGFPSIHTALATAISLTIMPHLPKKWRWLAIAWIVSVGWSRIYLGAHAPLDVIGGIIVGLIALFLGNYLPWPSTKQTDKTE